MKVSVRILFLAFIGLGNLVVPANATAQEQLILGVPLEPPNLDPTSGAAAAVEGAGGAGAPSERAVQRL